MDIVRLSQFPAVAASAKSTLVTNELLDQSVHGLILEMGGTFTKAQITAIKVRLDGKNIVEAINGTQMQAMNTYDGMPDTTNYLFIWFGDPTARTIRGQHLGDLDLSIIRKPLEIAIDIGAATTPTLQVHAIVGVPKMQMGLNYSASEASTFRAIVPSVIQPAGAVTHKQYPVPIGSDQGAKFRKAMFAHSNLTSVELRKSGSIKHDDVSVALNAAIGAEFARVAAAGFYVMDRVVDGNQGEAEMTVAPDGKAYSFQVYVTTSGADTIDTFADIHTLHPLL